MLKQAKIKIVNAIGVATTKHPKIAMLGISVAILATAAVISSIVIGVVAADHTAYATGSGPHEESG